MQPKTSNVSDIGSSDDKASETSTTNDVFATTSPSTTNMESEAVESATAAEQPATSTVNVTAIGVGAGLGTFILFSILSITAFCMLRRRRRQRTRQFPGSPNAHVSHTCKEEHISHHDHKRAAVGVSEVGCGQCGFPSKAYAEAPSGQGRPHELEATNAIHEAGGFTR